LKTFSIENVSKIQYKEMLNDEFALCSCWVMATKKNRNYSYIAKETVEQKLGTLDYCPVVGYLYKNDKGEYRIAGHEAHFDDDWELVPDTQAFGVVKPNSYHWETINEFGTEVDYLVADIILWVGRFKGLFDARYNDEIYFSQSMEISVNEYRPLDEDSNYVEILDFSFSALCLLGKYDNPDENVTPCFINAKVEPKFSVSEFASQIEEIKNKLFALNEEEGETMDNNENMTMELETEEVVETETEIVEETTEEVAEVDETTEEETTEEEVTVDYETKYNDALSEIETLKAQVAELTQSVEALTPYKLAAEKAERENAENDVFAKYDSRIGEMAEYAELKTKAGEYSIADLERECLILVGKFAMTETKTEEVEPETEPTITFALDETVEAKSSRYSDIYETYKSR
jgi:outer membrane murein-binding lipoprotein Lpp